MSLLGLPLIAWVVIALGAVGGLLHHMIVTSRLDQLATADAGAPDRAAPSTA